MQPQDSLPSASDGYHLPQSAQDNLYQPVANPDAVTSEPAYQPVRTVGTYVSPSTSTGYENNTEPIYEEIVDRVF